MASNLGSQSFDGGARAGAPTRDASDAVVPILEGRDLSKQYGVIHALTDVSFKLHAGEVVGLVGDNGAGKSTLLGILSGAIPPSGGEVYVEGERRILESPLDARLLGIETVFQDLALAPDLSISDNIFLGRERLVSGPRRWLAWLDRAGMADYSTELLARLSIQLGRRTSARARSLSGGQRQAVAIARAFAWSSKVLLLDEPTAALGIEQQQHVAQLVADVAQHGLGVMLVSHNLPQVLELADRVLVLRRGRLVIELPKQATDLDEVVRWITGSAESTAGASA